MRQYARAVTQFRQSEEVRFCFFGLFSFRLSMADIARSAVFSYPSVSFVPFCIVLRIKVLAVLP